MTLDVALHDSVPPLLEVRNVTKRYGRTVALSAVDLVLPAGKAIGIVGENGAGKSTLAKVLAGAETPDEGSVLLSGSEVAFGSPRDAQRAGIAFIPQELSFVPNLTVAENLVLNSWPRRMYLTSQRAMRERAAEQIERFGLSVPLDARMRDLRLADQQMVEILKALSRRSSVLILDEPTAALSDREAGDLFAALARLKDHNVGVILISHRMDEVLRFCDRIDVFRNGRNVLSQKPEETTVTEVISHMLGRATESARPQKASPARAADVGPVVELKNWQRDAHPHLRDVSLTLWPGEIVCVFGVRGCGAETLAEGLIGRHRDINGTISIKGIERPITRAPRTARRWGISYVPPDRKRQGLFIESSIARNISMMALQKLSRFGYVSARSEQGLAAEWVDRFGVRHWSTTQRVGDLSGGNQQKVLLASRLATHPMALVLQEPTRGVDVGARLQIHAYLRKIAASGTAILIVTADVEEAVGVADRLEIMREGAMVRTLVEGEITQQQALQAATADVAT